MIVVLQYKQSPLIWKVYSVLPSSCEDTLFLSRYKPVQKDSAQKKYKAFCGTNKMFEENPSGANWALWVISWQFIESL